MSTTYRCHPIFVRVNAAASRGIGALLIAVWLMPLMAMASGVPFSVPLLRVPILASVSLLIAGMLIGAAVRDARTLCLKVSQDGITKDTSSTKQILPYSGVLAFDYRRLPIVLGRGYLRAPSGSMSIPLTLSNIPELIATLQLNLVQEGKTEVFTNPSVERFLNDSAAVNRALDRFARYFAPAFRTTTIAFVVGILVAQFFWNFYPLLALVWGGVSALFPIAGYLSANSWITGKEIRTGANVDEKKVLVLAGGITLVLYLMAGIIVSQTW